MGWGRKLYSPLNRPYIYIQAISKLKNREQFEGGLHENRKGKEKKGKKWKRLKEDGERHKKWLRVLKRRNYLEFVLFPCF